MSQSTLRVEELASTRPSDPVFGIAAGLYLALLLSPAVLLFVSVADANDPATLYGAFLATGAVTLALTGLVFSRRPGLVPRLGSSRLTWLPALLGVVAAGGALASFEFGGGVSVLGVFLGLFAALVGLPVGALAHSRYAAAVLERAPEQAVFESGWPDRARKRLFTVVGVAAALSGVAFVVGVVAGPDWLVTVGQSVFAVVLGVTGYARSRTASVTPAGLAIRDPLFTRLHPWSAFEGYSRTDDAIVLRRRWRVDLRFAVDDLDASAGVEEAIARHLATGP